MWKVVGQHLFLNIIPSSFTAKTRRKVWCGRSMTRRRWMRPWTFPTWIFFPLPFWCYDEDTSNLNSHFPSHKWPSCCESRGEPEVSPQVEAIPKSRWLKLIRCVLGVIWLLLLVLMFLCSCLSSVHHIYIFNFMLHKPIYDGLVNNIQVEIGPPLI